MSNERQGEYDPSHTIPFDDKINENDLRVFTDNWLPGRLNRQRIYILEIVLFAMIISFLAKEVLAGEEWGYLRIYNRVDSLGSNHSLKLVRDDEYCPDANDGIDQSDSIEISWVPSLASGIFSIVDNNELWQDVRPNQSTMPYNIRLVIHNSFLSEEKSNYLEVELIQFEGEPYADFGGKPILFQQTSSTNPSAFYPVYDLRKALAQNGGIIPLESVAAGSYNKDDPYGTGKLTIGGRFLSDLDDSNEVNLTDYAIFVQNWGETGVDSASDISGPNGIPDGYVNCYDLEAYCDDYLADVNDPNTW